MTQALCSKIIKHYNLMRKETRFKLKLKFFCSLYYFLEIIQSYARNGNMKQPHSFELSVLNFLMLFIQERNMLKENGKSALGMHQNLDPDSGITEMRRFSPMTGTQNWSNIANWNRAGITQGKLLTNLTNPFLQPWDLTYIL